jgi:hypothetical protein
MHKLQKDIKYQEATHKHDIDFDIKYGEAAANATLKRSFRRYSVFSDEDQEAARRTDQDDENLTENNITLSSRVRRSSLRRKSVLFPNL